MSRVPAVLTPCAYALALVAAALGEPIVFVAAIAATFVLEPWLKTAAPKANRVFGRVGFGLSVRYALRDAALVTAVVRLFPAGHLAIGVVVASVVVLVSARAGQRYLIVRTDDRRSMPVTTRNVDLSALSIPAPLPRWTGNDSTMLVAAAIPVAGTLAAWLAGSAVIAAIAAALAALGAAGFVVAMLPAARRAGRHPSAKKAMTEVQRQITAYAPAVVVYFSGNRTAMYQIDMWLPVIERLDQRALILLRDRANLPLLAPTTLPVVCLPDPVDVMNFALPSMRVALYPAHTGNNIHFLRIPAVTHAFICHGESDKSANANPYSKAYDQVWVAGPAARERYARADVGVRDEDIVEVGGPQMAAVERAAADRRPERMTVLYAPTWEGWSDDAQNTSLTASGPAIVAALLAHPDVASVLYKPHPLTGTRSAATARSDRAIRRADVLVRTDLYDCFNECDALIGDISGVLTEFLVSDKPYVVTNASGLDAEAFRQTYPTTRGAYLIGPDAAGLPALLTALRHGDDP
ncbi:MAG TPA: CDP-glycerol glycerophosphotransferase family protein, partial [Micromonosporaceae bacterium]